MVMVRRRWHPRTGKCFPLRRRLRLETLHRKAPPGTPLGSSGILLLLLLLHPLLPLGVRHRPRSPKVAPVHESREEGPTTTPLVVQ
jgi:hypothetical protein